MSDKRTVKKKPSTTAAKHGQPPRYAAEPKPAGKVSASSQIGLNPRHKPGDKHGKPGKH